MMRLRRYIAYLAALHSPLSSAPPASSITSAIAEALFTMVSPSHCTMQALASRNLVHFDIKGENVLLESLTGAEEDTVWSCPPDQPPFKCVLADFGVSRQYASAAAAFTVR